MILKDPIKIIKLDRLWVKIIDKIIFTKYVSKYDIQYFAFITVCYVKKKNGGISNIIIKNIFCHKY